MKATIYHNPRCSKSRSTMALLESAGIDMCVVEYLRTPPSKETLATLLQKLPLDAKDLVRTGDAEFGDSGLDLSSASDEQIIDLLHAQPKLMQRPIVETIDDARVGRPPECVMELFE